jgi:AcrR family transcriptional regulator
MANDEPATTTFDLLWVGERGVKRGRRPSLSRETLVHVAMELADAEGIAAVTMQRVAALVDSKAMSLYRYVPSKEVLLDLMWDAAFAGPPKLGSGGWRSRLTRWASANFERLEQHPWMIELVGAARSVGPRWTAWLDEGLEAMAALPLTASEKLAVLMVIDGHLRSSARLRFGVKADPQWAADFGRMLQRSTTDDRYPTVGAMVRRGDFNARGMSMTQMFGFGLERILDGVETYSQRPRARVKRKAKRALE